MPSTRSSPSDFLAAVQAGVTAGKTAAEIASGWKIDETKYKVYNIAAERLKQNVAAIAAEPKK